MAIELITTSEWARRCAADGEFALSARHWNGGIRLAIGDTVMGLTLADGQVSPGEPVGDEGVLEYSGTAPVWEEVLQQRPKRFHNDLMANLSAGQGLQRRGNPVVHGQYYAALMRAVELLRPAPEDYELWAGDAGSAKAGASVSSAKPATMGATDRVQQAGDAVVDSPVGRYIHLNLGGFDHRIYYEAAGEGIPLLLQHTAGCHGSQWRHLFEAPEITQKYRLIAYDLPCHGKSLPPPEDEWWAKPYQLQGEFLRSVPVALAAALGLQDPVFMGCSVGGLLALDLAHKHADLFRAVISVEGALKIAGDLKDLGELYHPQISNDYKARLMDGLMSPTSPKAYRKETSFVYSSGWPPAFLGDLFYYIQEFDLTQQAAQIDTQKVGVHILSGEYDYSGTSELGQAAHAAIPGSTWALMEGVGHFPMSENPEAFLNYLLPILRRIA